MSMDAFDQWRQWAEQDPETDLGLPSDIYHAVLSLPEPDQLDRNKVNEAVREHARLRAAGRTVWVYLNQGEKSRTIGDPDWVKLFASEEAADKWLEEHDPEGVAWEYVVEGEAPARAR